MNEWINLRIEWVKIMKEQYARDAEKRSAALSKLRTLDKDGKPVYNVEERCKYVYVCAWFEKEGG
ncbi:hypothetical protein P3T76_014771 [Phytophthora citrophthora]|uniref:Uncharacterized protein n=1 Tax=Phytophthora citrophthora TaxID=4793 RepID=A0AAD9LAY2_9STRA|nr:hypothetical protein P3T76_014771 [Phytophthora citrophthora]